MPIPANDVARVDPSFRKVLDNMKAKCTAVSIDAGGKQYIDGACALTDSDGDA